jgi:hypothetical protein
MAIDHKNSFSLRVKNASSRALTIVLEPWAGQYEVQPGDELDVVETGGELMETVEVHTEDARLIFYARTGSIMTAWRDGQELP